MKMVGGVKRFKVWSWFVAGEKERGEEEGGKEADSRINCWEIIVRRNRRAAEALKRRDGLWNLDRKRRSAQVAQGAFSGD